jgi:translocation and assembly module TamB
MNLFSPFQNRRWKLTLGVSALLMVTLLWFAPSLVVHSPLWPRILANVTKDMAAQIQTGSVSVGWLSPIRVRDLSVQDATSGATIVTCKSVQLEKNLWNLIWDRTQLGTIRVEQPHVKVVFQQSSSNLEQLLASWLEGPSSSSPPPCGQVEIVAGQIDVTDSITGDLATLSNIEASLFLPGADRNANWGCQLKQCIVVAEGAQGSCQLDARWGKAAKSPSDTGTNVTVSVKADQLALGVVQPLIRRFEPNVQLAGVLSSNVQAQWNPTDRQAVAFIQRLAIESLDLVAPAWLGKDRLRVRQLAVQGKCRLVGDQLQLEQLNLQSDFATADARGQWTWPVSSETGSRAPNWEALLGGAFSINGTVDIAQLAATLPTTMRIRSDTKIVSGKVGVQVQCQPHEDGRRWSGDITTSDWSAVRDGEPLVWKQPLGVQLKVLRTPRQLTIQELTCRCEFLQLTGSGTSSAGQLSLGCNLNQMKQEFSQLMDLRQVRLEGTLTGSMNWKILAGDVLKLESTAQLQQFAIQLPSSGLWQEPQLTLVASAEGTANAPQIREVTKASVSLRTPSDRLDVALLAPVKPNAELATWPVGLRVQGVWSSWISRVRPFASLPPGNVEGTIDLNAKVQLNSEAIALTEATFKSQPFRVSSPTLSVNEPVVELEAVGRWDRTTGDLKIGNCVFRSSAMALRAQHVAASFGADQRQLSGDFAARANLESLANTWRFANSPSIPWRLLGLAKGSVSLTEQSGVLTARWNASLEKGELQCNPSVTGGSPRIVAASTAPKWVTVMSEPEIQFIGSVQYNPSRASVNMEHMELATADEQRLIAKGTISDLFGACVADLDGQVTYDLARVIERARPLLGPSLSAIGQDTQTFSLKGPLRNSVPSSESVNVSIPSTAHSLVSSELAGHCGLSWTAADLLGVTVGGGQIQPRLSHGTVETGPLVFPLSHGHFRLVPHVHLNQQPPSLTIDPGQILDSVEISEAMCAGWLKFVAPLVAESTRANGVFSLKLDSTTVPLFEPRNAKVRGELHIQRAVLGPGPLAEELLAAVDGVKAMLKASSSVNASPPTQDQFNALPNLLMHASGLSGAPSDRQRDPRSPSHQLNIPEQFVSFRVEDQRVYHDQFHVVVGNVTLSTSGSVGLDQSLLLVARIPIERPWIADERLWRVVEGKSIEIPITGTIRSPRMDSKRVEQAVRNMAGDLLRDSTGRILDRELQRGLNQLFRQ